MLLHPSNGSTIKHDKISLLCISYTFSAAQVKRVMDMQAFGMRCSLMITINIHTDSGVGTA
jgi:hypothetical protein